MILVFILSLAVSCSGLLAASLEGDGGFMEITTESNDAKPLMRLLDSSGNSFSRITGYPHHDYPPIRVIITAKSSSPSLSVNALEGGDPEIRLVLPSSAEDSQTGSFLAIALLLREYYGKTAPVPGSAVPHYPDWVSRGLGALMLQLPLNAGTTAQNQELAAFLSQRVPDSENASLLSHYDAQAAALVSAGMSDDRGRSAFREWVGSYDPSQSSGRSTAWIDGWDMRGVERRWVLGLHAPESKDQLPGSIQSATTSLEEYRRIMEQGRAGSSSLAELSKKKGGEYSLQKFGEKLTALRLQANPMVAPLVDQTMKLVTTARHASPKKITEEEAHLQAEYLAIAKQSRGIEDYLNWYEAAKVESPSGMFEGYLTAPSSPVAKGPIGRYLDQFEARGW